MVKFGVSTYSIVKAMNNGDLTAEQAIAWLGKQGAEVIELVPFGMDFIKDPSLIDLLLKTAKENNSVISNYSVGANFVNISKEDMEKEIATAKLHIDVAHKFGLKTLRVDCTGNTRTADEYVIEIFDKDIETITEGYRALCDYAKPLGICVLIENHGFHANGRDRVRKIIKSVDRENFGHQLDIGNYICVDDIPEVSVKAMLPFAKVIHMKDFYVRSNDRNPGDAPDFSCSGAWFKSTGGNYLRGSIFGQGDIDVYKIMKYVKQSGYEGNIILEYEGIEDCLYSTKVGLDNMKRIYNEVVVD